ncbi:glycosyltransferase family 50 protein [Suillus clintonianus]|uniref:glycosyltransferase family 50 protein n=1 Tax=Suillus clintonianus TaxID=1904413 RepID=UPI001B86D885|nr:glycosyltransferase family 50 protein [Suillus clintonianus]KAG2157250.1 glycosyltransferase family 50 protein [Suillus clintonianus]
MQPKASAAWQDHIPGFGTLLFVSAILRVVLILYSEWHDAHSIVKYTDIDYRVFSDAARFILYPNLQDNIAKGPLAPRSFTVGDPYTRKTYRYTPLLAILLLPNEYLHPSFGKYLFAACDLINGVLIYKILMSHILPYTKSLAPNVSAKNSERFMRAHATLLAATHLLNPLVFTISTRGSSEAILCTFVLLTLFYALEGRQNAAAVMLGLSAHWKIYPIIYGVSCVSAITSQRAYGKGWGFAYLRHVVGRQALCFTLLSAGTFIVLGATCYAMWGYPFLYEAYLYHTDRRDHRHNFSPYFYLIYLTSGGNSVDLSIWRQLLRSPFTSLIPQLTLSLGTGLVLGRFSADLPFVWFVQTFTFVLFNRVCTSQYFIWYTLFIPLLVPRINLSWKKWVMCGAVWMGTQALWLAEAYKLEFLGDDVFFGLWVRSLLYVAGHAWVLGVIMSGYTPFVCNQHTQTPGAWHLKTE